MWDLDTTKVPLARAEDCAVRESWQGSPLTNAPIAKWSMGYEWTVTFLHTEAAPAKQLLSSPSHALAPRDAVVHVRGLDCARCYYIPGLALGEEVFVRVFAHNDA